MQMNCQNASTKCHEWQINYLDPSTKYDKWQIDYVSKFINRIDGKEIIKGHFLIL